MNMPSDMVWHTTLSLSLSAQTYVKNGVTDVVRTCDEDYSPDILTQHGISFHVCEYK
jgi:hypothetical protein